jgi:hypothetical protein
VNLTRKKKVSVMKKFESNIVFKTQYHDNIDYIEMVRLNLSDTTLNNIIKAQDYMKTCGYDIVAIEIPFGDGDEIDHIDEDGEITKQWLCDVRYLKVYPTGFYYYAQNKYDSSDQLESDLITC